MKNPIIEGLGLVPVLHVSGKTADTSWACWIARTPSSNPSEAAYHVTLTDKKLAVHDSLQDAVNYVPYLMSKKFEYVQPEEKQTPGKVYELLSRPGLRILGTVLTDSAITIDVLNPSVEVE